VSSRRLLLPVLAASIVALAACASKKKEKDVNAPATLVAFPASLKVDRVWETGVSGKPSPLRLTLTLAVDGERVYATSDKGEVESFELQSGHSMWKTHLKGTLSGGTAAGDGLVVVATNKGEVIALDQANGAVRWRARVRGEVLAPAAIGPSIVVVRTVDGKLHGLAPADGKESWLQEEQIPRLTLRGTATPVLAGDIVICGFDNGKVMGVNLTDGSTLWEATVSPPKGKTELERLVDIDTSVRVIDQDVYVVGFQGRAAMLALESGQVWWARDFSSYRGLDVDADAVYISTAEGEVVAARRKTGTELWHQKGLLHRGLSGPTVSGSAVVVGDAQGFVHWLDRSTGAFAGRAQLGGRISTQPVAVGDLLLVINDTGRIAAYRTTPLSTATAAPAKASPAG
jgi:outer membrane protein assembly factor BamB